MNDWLQTFGQVLLIVVIGALVLAAVALLLAYRSLRRINVPPDADFWTTIRAVPLGLVIGLDLLDLGLDIFATPIVWIVLTRFRLQALRNVAALEALVPFTQPIPTLTIAWFAARLLGMRAEPQRNHDRVLDVEEVAPGEYAPRGGRR